jgi:hypothetical protein
MRESMLNPCVLRSGGYLFADGTRNAFDPEFGPNGVLMAGDNAGFYATTPRFRRLRRESPSSILCATSDPTP